MTKRTLALTTAGTLVAGTAVAAFWAVPAAQADGPERHANGKVGGARYDIDIEKEGTFEIDVDLDGVAAGSKWRLVVRHDGKKVATRTAHAEADDDGGYDADFPDVTSGDTAGKDTFKVTIARVDGEGKVTRTLVFAK